jgi:transcriptional regulator of heat shock response
MHKDTKKRQEEVLALIVRHYVETAEPVGSRYVAKHLGLSSATIRNAMADLEESGLITHPHTSAGRIPTDRGYRYYIDLLMRVKVLNPEMTRSVRMEYRDAMRSLESVLERATYLVSSITNYVGINLFAEYHKLYMDGTSHIIEQPEFRDLKKLHAILKSLEEKSDILNILDGEFEDDRLMIHIGKENKLNWLSDCSIVTRGYKMKGKFKGRMGVIGPKRMVYERVIPAVEFLADTVTEMLEELEN